MWNFNTSGKDDSRAGSLLHAFLLNSEKWQVVEYLLITWILMARDSYDLTQYAKNEIFISVLRGPMPGCRTRCNASRGVLSVSHLCV